MKANIHFSSYLAEFCLLRHVCPSAPHRKIRLSVDGFSLNVLFENLKKKTLQNSSIIKVGQE
jgi:hypothetical protein